MKEWCAYICMYIYTSVATSLGFLAFMHIRKDENSLPQR